MHKPTLRRIGTLTFVIVCSAVVPSLFSSLESAITPHFDPVAFGLPSTAHEVPSKRTEKAVTFAVAPGKFASVSTGNQVQSPSCDKATLSTLCQAVSLVRGIIPYAFATSQGPNSPGTVVNVASQANWTHCSNVYAWTTPENAVSSNNQYATFDSGPSSKITECLKATGFGFSIPDGATINGVELGIERKSSILTGPDFSRDDRVYLLKAGIPSGNDKGDTATKWPTTDGVATYGTSSDLWGNTLTPSDVNASDFGATLNTYLSQSPA